jgi:riboflavin biosynthesis pyrimidine reductase
VDSLLAQPERRFTSCESRGFSYLSGGIIPLEANRSITRASSASRCESGGGPIKIVTTQSPQAISRIVQVSQSMIMERRIEGSTDIRSKYVKRYLLAMRRVRANLVVGSNGMTTYRGSSKGLSSSEDRARFHELRSASEVILIGGSTFRNEPYSKCPLPLYISSRGSNLKGENVHSFNLSPSKLLAKAFNDGYKEILIEGGVQFLSGLFDKTMIDEFHLTRSDIEGDGDKFDETSLSAKYKLLSQSIANTTKFEVWVPINQPR